MMPGMDMAIPHELEREEALKRIRGLLADLKREYGPASPNSGGSASQARGMIEDLKEEWTKDFCRFSFTVMGSPVSGTFENGEKEVRISAHLPFAAALFKGKIEAVIREKARELLS